KMNKEVETQNALPQMDVSICNLILILPKATTSNEQLKGVLHELRVRNDVLKNDSLHVELKNLEMGVLFEERKELNPLFQLRQIDVHLSNEFTNIGLSIADWTLDLSKKEYDFLMHFISGNLMEQSQIAKYIYPKQRVNEIISENQRQRLEKAAIERGKEQMAKGVNISLNIDNVRMSVLKGYGTTKDRKDALIDFTIQEIKAKMAMPPTGILTVDVSVKDMFLEDVSIDTRQKNVLTQYRQLVSFADFSSDDKIKGKQRGYLGSFGYGK
ncbi:hypothetical protein RFI_01434, partial [Reticulomyxa filosa]